MWCGDNDDDDDDDDDEKPEDTRFKTVFGEDLVIFSAPKWPSAYFIVQLLLSPKFIDGASVWATYLMTTEGTHGYPASRKGPMCLWIYFAYVFYV